MFFIEERGRDLFAAAERLDLEGMVAKRKAEPYSDGVTWYKIRGRRVMANGSCIEAELKGSADAMRKIPTRVRVKLLAV